MSLETRILFDEYLDRQIIIAEFYDYHRNAMNKENKTELIEAPKMKYCPPGEHTVPVSEFFKETTSKDGLGYACKVCCKKRYKQKYSEKQVGRTQRDKMRVNAFLAFYKAARLGGKSFEEAFVSAVCGSCDEVFDKLPAGSFERWLKFKGKS